MGKNILNNKDKYKKDKQNGKTTIKREIFVAVLISTFIIVTLLAVFLSYNLYRNSFENVNSYVYSHNKNIATYIEGYFTEIMNTVEVLSSNQDIINAQNSIQNKNKSLLMYKNYEIINKNITYIYSGYEDGELLINDYIPPENFDSTERPWYKVAEKDKGKVSIGNPYQDANTKDWLISTSKTLIEDNKIKGVIAIDCSMVSVTNVIDTKLDYETGYNFVLNEKKEVIIHYDSEQIGKVIIDDIDSFSSKSKKRININGIDYVIAINKIENIGWYLVTVVDSSEFILPLIKKLILYFVGFLFITILLVLIQSFILGKKFANPIIEVSKKLKKLAESDLTVTEITDISNNEIGIMAQNYNTFLNNIKQVIQRIKNMSIDMDKTGKELSQNMDKNTKSIRHINESIKTVKQQAVNQSVSVNETSSTMKNINNLIMNVNTMIKKQANNVETSSSTIEIMISKIKEVTETLVNNSENIKKLENESSDGKKDLNSVSETIMKVSKESEGLVEVSDVILDIASQTDLLSMNASIEAAHAGESGKGFSVVAEEIRKLAEDSGSQAKIISEKLKNIKDSIDYITESIERVLRKFDLIDREIQSVSNQELEIKDSMQNVMDDGNAVLKEIQSLNSITENVENGSSEIMKGSNDILSETKNLNTMTESVSTNMNNMNLDVDSINLAIENVNKIGDTNKNNINILVKEINKFNM